jgi:uncharacterized phage protein gp47/JayE
MVGVVSELGERLANKKCPRMPWQNPTLEQLRAQSRDNVTAQLRSGPLIPNSVARVLADTNAGIGFLTLLYLNWLALQLLPDTAEGEWLDRQAQIWVGGRKASSFAAGTVTLVATGTTSVPVPQGTVLSIATPQGPFTFQTMAEITVTTAPTPIPMQALTAGATELSVGTVLNLSVAIQGVSAVATIASITDGVDDETDDELRARVLDRIREPPMGGDANDYVQWALQVPGVTRAWCSPNEMGIGTVTVRFMMDTVRATSNPLTNGFPTAADVTAVTTYLQTKRPVAVKDFFVEAPIPYPISVTVNGLLNNDAATWTAITASVNAMLLARAAPAFAVNGVTQPAQTIFAVWISDAILQAAGVVSFDLVASDFVMPSNGSLAVLGSIIHGT